jgi:hypothetical protein
LSSLRIVFIITQSNVRKRSAHDQQMGGTLVSHLANTIPR